MTIQTREQVSTAVSELIKEFMGSSPEKVVPSAKIDEDLDADSLDKIEMVMGLEDQFNIEIPDQDAEKFLTVQDVTDYICTSLKIS